MHRFVLNTDDLDRFVAERAARLDAGGQAWAARHLARFLRRDPRCLHRPGRLPERDDVRRNLARARQVGAETAWFEPPAEVETEVGQVLDWIGALPEIDPRLAGKRDRIAYADACRRARQWHARLGRRDSVVEDDPRGHEPVLDLGGGRVWLRLHSRAALDYEGARMRHCIGDGSYDRFRTALYSLRDPDNKPHCTLEYDPARHRIQQVRGLANEDVPAKYLDAVEALLRHLRPKRLSARLTEFVVREDGEILRLSQAADWAPGTRVCNNLVLTNRDDVTRLPDGLHVAESLILANCSLSRLPRNLHIGQALAGLPLSPVTRLPEGLKVRVLNLEDSLVKEIASGTRVTKELSLVNAPLQRLPEDLTVGQLLILDGAAMPSLPRDLEVAGRRVAEVAPRHLPETLVVFGEVGYTDLIFDGGSSLAIYGRLSFSGWENPEFPRRLWVYGDFDLKHSTLDPDRAAAAVEVHGTLDLRGTDLDRLPEGWRVFGRVLRD